METLPVFDCFNEEIKDNNKATHIFLFYALASILGSIESSCNNEELAKIDSIVNENSIMIPGIKNGFWTESSFDKTKEFLKFIPNEHNYTLSYLRIQEEEKRLLCTNYNAWFLDEKTMYIIDLNGIRSLAIGKPISPYSTSFFSYKIEKNKSDKNNNKIFLTNKLGKETSFPDKRIHGEKFNLKLELTQVDEKSKEYKYYEKWFNSEYFTFTDYDDYVMPLKIAAITPDAVFISLPSEKGKYYCVKKSDYPIIKLLNTDDFIILWCDQTNKKFLFIPKLSLSLNISTLEDIQASKVTIVDSIIV